MLFLQCPTRQISVSQIPTKVLTFVFYNLKH
jgi:hypothetical protein